MLAILEPAIIEHPVVHWMLLLIGAVKCVTVLPKIRVKGAGWTLAET